MPIFYGCADMTLLIFGLVIFLGAHSIRMVAEGWRTRFIAARGEGAYKGLYTIVSLAGLALLVWGYGAARAAPVDLWSPPVWTRHLAALLMLLSFILLAAAYVPRNHIKAAMGHPMVLGVKVWALAHLISNGRLADVLLFGSFLVWAVLNFRASRKRDRINNTMYPAGTGINTAIAVVAGAVLWAVFALWLHVWLIGVAPFGV
jgi:uncharacterized membrane protein